MKVNVCLHIAHVLVINQIEEEKGGDIEGVGWEREKERKITPSPAGENSQTYVFMIYICELFAFIIQNNFLTFLVRSSTESTRSVSHG